MPLNSYNTLMITKKWHKEATDAEIELAYRKDMVLYMEDQFHVKDIDQTVELAEAQKAFIRKAVSKDDKGNICYNVVAYTALKKSFKTGITAGRSIWTCLEPNKEVFFIARSKEQATDRAFTMVTDSLKENPYPVVTKMNKHEVIFANGSKIKCLPCTLAVAGINFDLICLTEGWSWHDNIHRVVFSEIAVPPARAHVAAIHIDSYAGFTDVESVISRLWGDVVKDRKPDEDDKYPGVYYSLGRVLYIQDQVPRLTHQTPSYYKTQKLVLPDADYARQCLNKHVHSLYKGEDTNIFSAVNDDFNPFDLDDDWLFYGALDMAMVSDLASICVIAYNESLERAVEIETVVFSPPIAFITVEAEIERLYKRYNLVELGLDIWQTGYLSQKLPYTRPVGQGKEREAGDSLTFNWLKTGKLELVKGGHVADAFEIAGRKQTGNGNIRFVKPQNRSKAKIDPVVACSMALFCAVHPDKRVKKKLEEGPKLSKGIPFAGSRHTSSNDYAQQRKMIAHRDAVRTIGKRNLAQSKRERRTR